MDAGVLLLHNQIRKVRFEEELFAKLAAGEAETSFFLQQSAAMETLHRRSPLGLN
jgi:hypothetical protein